MSWVRSRAQPDLCPHRTAARRSQGECVARPSTPASPDSRTTDPAAHGQQRRRSERRCSAQDRGLASTLTNAVLALILSIYWTADRLRFERLALSSVPAHRRSDARDLARARRWVGYLRSELLQGVLLGVLLWPIFRLLGLNWPVFWALAWALSWLVPLVGGFIVIVPLWMVVWAQSGVLTATLAVAAVLIVMALLEARAGTPAIRPRARCERADDRHCARHGRCLRAARPPYVACTGRNDPHHPEGTGQSHGAAEPAARARRRHRRAAGPPGHGKVSIETAEERQSAPPGEHRRPARTPSR